MALKSFIRNFTDSVGLTYEEEEELKNTESVEEQTKLQTQESVAQLQTPIQQQTSIESQQPKQEKAEVKEIVQEEIAPPFIANTRLDNTMSEDCNTVFVNPKNFAECRKIADYIKNDKVVTLNLENIEHKDAQRILDFLSGAITIKEARWIPISKNVFTSVPKNTGFFYDGKADVRNNFLNLDQKN